MLMTQLKVGNKNRGDNLNKPNFLLFTFRLLREWFIKKFHTLCPLLPHPTPLESQMVSSNAALTLILMLTPFKNRLTSPQRSLSIFYNYYFYYYYYYYYY